MTKDLHNRLERLERALGVSDSPAIDLPKLSAEEFDAALAAAAAAPACATVGMVGPPPGGEPPAMAEAFKEARMLMQAALAIGWTRLGFQREISRYLDVALPEMFPEPRSQAAAAMAAVLRTDELAIMVMRYIPVLAGGHPVPDGWRPE